MEAEHFFSRWSRRKMQPPDAEQAVLTKPGAEPPSPVDDPVRAPPTLDDVAALTTESDFTPFMARGVDPTVRRGAMKKLFTDPHFNLMDGLDTYVGDFHTFEPIPPEMLAILTHAQALLNPLAQLESPLMRLLESPLESSLESSLESPLESPLESSLESPLDQAAGLAGASAAPHDQADPGEGAAAPAQAGADRCATDAINETRHSTADTRHSTLDIHQPTPNR